MATHANRAHSALGASSAERWFNCPASPRLSEGMPNTSSTYARQGTAGHQVAEICLRGGYAAKRFRGTTQEVEGEVVAITDEMLDAIQIYLDTVRRDYRPGDRLIVEKRFDLSALHPTMFGTCDAVLYRPSTGELKVYDLKMGRGYAVEVEKDGKPNRQLMYYAVGAALAKEESDDAETLLG